MWGVVFFASWCSPALAVTAEELVARNIEARGGQAHLDALKSLKLSGKLIFGGSFELDLVQYKKRPGLLRSEASVQGLTAIQAYDGQEGWQVQPFGGRKDPEKLSADDAKSLIEDADLDGPLVGWHKPGATIAYLGVEDVDGTEAHKLQVTQQNGDKQVVFLDPDFYLEIRVVSTRMQRGVEQQIQTDLGDYEKVNDVYFPFSIEQGPPGAPPNQRSVIALDRAEANIDIDDAQFNFPQAAQ